MKTTKELARELGLLRRRTLASSKDLKPKDQASGQDFKYLILIDFESTCWKEGKFRTQEIIEFPAVLLNTSTGEVENEFHHYVMPEEQPTLSAFCTELTGITQDKVENGIPLNLCLRRFRNWLNTLYAEKDVLCAGTNNPQGKQENSNTTCVTWSDWDLGVCLQYECKRKQILKPPELTCWIDLRATYRKFYQRKPNGLNGALQDLGINFQGREHSGVDDARNTAKLAYRLIQDGCQLKVTKSLKNHERSSSCDPSIGSYFKPERNTSKPRTSCSESTQVKPCRNTPSKIPRPVHCKSPHLVKLLTTDSGNNVETTDNGSENLTTSVKLRVSCKRKEMTPSKVKLKDMAVSSPCRKAPRKFTPKKFPTKDIYVDSNSCLTSTADYNSEVKAQPVLKEQNKNIPVGNETPVQSRKSTQSKKTMPDSTNSRFKKPNPVTRQRCMTASETVRNNCIDKNFYASTPVGSGVAPKLSLGKDTISPVLSAKLNPGKIANNMSIPQTFRDSCSSMTASTPFNSYSSYKTPNTSSSTIISHTTFLNGTTSTSMKMTPPLCKCGRRSKRKMVQSPGQNMGRFFFSCGIRKGAWSKEGCDFFKWEVLTGVRKPNSSISRNGASISRQFTPVVNKSISTDSSQKRNLGVRQPFKTPMCIR